MVATPTSTLTAPCHESKNPRMDWESISGKLSQSWSRASIAPETLGFSSPCSCRVSGPTPLSDRPSVCALPCLAPMSVRKRYSRNFNLPDPWDWQVVRALDAVLSPKVSLAANMTRLDTHDGQRAEADSVNDLAAEYPDPTDVKELTFSYSGAAGLWVHIWWIQPEGWGPSYASVQGEDEAQVYGIAAIIERFTEREAKKAEAAAEQASALSVSPPTGIGLTRDNEDDPAAPIWKQGWFWGAVGAILTIIGILLAVNG